MAKKVIKSPRGNAARAGNAVSSTNSELHAQSSQRRAGWLIARLVVAMIAIGTVLWFRPWLTQTENALPPAPDLSGRPAQFLAAYSKAHDIASQAGEQRLQGIEQLARLYHANGFNDQALASWKLLQSAQPTNARWFYYQADLHRLMLADDQAIESLLTTVRLDPSYAPAWLNLAELSLKSGNLDRADQAYRACLRVVPGDPYARLGVARIALQRGDVAEARRELSELVRDHEKFAPAHNLYAGVLSAAGETELAARERWAGTVAGRFRPASDPWIEELRAWCFDPEQLLIWGDAEAQAQIGDRGRSLLERALKIAPDSGPVYVRLGQLHLDTPDPRKAIEVLKRGAQLPNVTEKLFISLSEAYGLAGRTADGVRAGQRAVSIQPNASSTHAAYAAALERAQRFREAEEEFHRAIGLSPNSAEPVASLGLLLLRQGRREEGAKYLRDAVSIQPNFPIAATLVGALAIEAGDAETASRYILPYYEQYPGLPEARDLVAKLYLLKGFQRNEQRDLAGLEQACRDGLAKVPESADLNACLGALYAQQQHWEQARAPLEKACALRADDTNSAWLLSQTYVALNEITDARNVLLKLRDRAKNAGDAALALRCSERLSQLVR